MDLVEYGQGSCKRTDLVNQKPNIKSRADHFSWGAKVCPTLVSQYTNNCSFIILGLQSQIADLIAKWIMQSMCLKSVTARAVCVSRSYSFKGLSPGSQYTITVISTSGMKRSKSASMILHTSKFKMQCVFVHVYVHIYGKNKNRNYSDHKINLAKNKHIYKWAEI